MGLFDGAIMLNICTLSLLAVKTTTTTLFLSSIEVEYVDFCELSNENSTNYISGNQWGPSTTRLMQSV